ncbi:L-aspartate oxidase [Tepidibacillus sp. LV47]|uniref:L-aspartate oxidase n=1 Tax=Tepidibacillus sp. LV47 TaxID=3398228 RepID=UPI003AB01D58
MKMRKADVIIIGSGIAGLYAAYLLSSKKKVILITKGKLDHSNSILAQGGIAAAIGKNDSWKHHFQDTIIAGHYHNVEEAVRCLVQNAPKIIQQLIDIGVTFDRDHHRNLELGREGGHHNRRIVHAGGDSTGKIIIEKLIKLIKPHVTIYEDEMVYELLTHNGNCVGVITKNMQGEYFIYQADHIVLATGGIGRLYPISSNDHTITGDGIAMAYRAGADLIDLEFIQFHPTMLVHNSIPFGLVSEAVRGEGARLVNQKGELIMEGIHPLKDLAPRDIVARTIYLSMQNGDQVYLDISIIKDFTKRFPTISKMCETGHIDINTGLLPIAPGAHFIMGGVKTNAYGETTLKGLYAIGEVAYTGVHGANRLASNSLLEGVVFANKVAEYIFMRPKKNIRRDPMIPQIQKLKLSLPEIKEIQDVMMKNVGIIRDEASLLFAKEWFEQFLPKFHSNMIIDLSFEEITRLNMVTTGWLITTSALKRTESRGGHFRKDYPYSNDEKWLKRYIVRRSEENEFNQVKNVTSTVLH